MSLRDFPLQKQQFPCRKQFQSELTLEQQNEQQSTPQLLQQLHIGLAEVPEENFNNKVSYSLFIINYSKAKIY